MPDPSATHPDLADLEAARTGEAPADVDAHVRACEECRRMVAELATCARALAPVPPPVPEPIEARDAFLIARALRSTAAPPSRFDVNGDRVVDERDVELAAHAAVALGRRS